MEPKKKALGRGLEQLFSNEMIDLDTLENNIIKTAKESDIININLSDLRSNPYQPRKHFEESSLQELAVSIKEHGVFQPIIVKKSIKGYEIVAGERRTKASVIAGLTTIPAIVKEFSDSEMMEIALLENLQREDLTAVEEAMAYKNIIESLDITQDELAKKLGKSRSHITNMLGILRLPLEVQDMVLKKEISMAHARVLSKLESREKIVALANKIVDENISVRQLEQIASETKEEGTKKTKVKNHSYYEYEHLISQKFGTKVVVTDKKLEIKYQNNEDLKRILDILDINIED